MGLTFVSAGLLAGAALAAVPFLIHLLMRQSPKPVVFPALRLIRQRHRQTTKRLQIKNWLLLAARMLLIALMALALARPAYNSRASAGDREVPTALALVFDTSLSMQYNERNIDRLTEAKQRALELLNRTHEGSQVFVIDSADPGQPVPLSPASARKRVEALTLRPVNRKLNAALGQAYSAVLGSELGRKEVYVLTDLARSAWDTARPADGLDKLDDSKQPVPAFVLRLSPKELRNAGIVDAEVRTAAGITTPGDAVMIKATIRGTGPASKRVVEFFLDGPTKRDQKEVEIPANGEVEVTFKTPKLDAGLHRGRLHLGGGTDPLPFDDERYLTFEVRPAYRVLVIADLTDDLDYIAEALDPSSLPEGEPRPFRVDRVLSNRLDEKTLEGLRDTVCVFLNNVHGLDESVWRRLSSFVGAGGGLVVAMGHRIDPARYADGTVARLLPATPAQVKRPTGGPTSFGQILDASHPIFRQATTEGLDDLNADLGGVTISQYMGLGPLSAGARTLLSFRDGAPALVERDVPGPKIGHVLVWTIPLSMRSRTNDPGAWNDWPIRWSFVDLLIQMVPYLAGASAQRWNYTSGEFIAIVTDPNQRFTSFLVQGPGSNVPNRLTPPAGRSSLLIEPPQSLGNGTVTATGADGRPTVFGFSVNPDPNESVLTALNPEELDTLLGGKDRYALAEDAESLKRATAEVRVGREIFPWLMLLILLLITAENFLANRFYREQSTPAPRPVPTRVLAASGSAT